MPAISIKRLVKEFEASEGTIKAVDSLSLTIEEGEIFGLLGPNGAGKTTLISMLATLQKPTAGESKVNGFDVVKEPAHVRQSIGIVFQDASSDDMLTGYENLKLHALMYDVPMQEIDQRINQSLELVDLKKRKNDFVKTYSGGMRRRLEIARSLLHTPKVLFLDEPTVGLDPQTREKMWEHIKKLKETKNITIVLTTHYMEEADALCDRIGIIDKGKIVILDTPQKLKASLGGEVIRLTTKEADISKIKRLSYVKKAVFANNLLVVTVDNASKRLQDLLERVKNVESVDLHSPTLNDVFLHYTGREIRDEEGEGSIFDRIAKVKSRGK